MKTQMTERDKKLLVGMFIFVIIVAIGYWGIIPQIKAYNKLGTKIDKEEVTKNINEQKVSNLIFVESMCEEYEETMADNKAKFYDMMTEAEIDFLLTTKAVSRNLEAYSLSIEIPSSPSDRKAYIYSQLYQDQLEWDSQRELLYMGTDEDEEDLLGTGDDKSSNKETTEDETVDIWGNTDMVGENTDIYVAKVSISLGGDEAQLKAYLDDIMASEKKILITSFSWGEYRTQQAVEVPVEEIIQADEKAESEEGETTTTTKKTETKYELVTVKSLTITMEIYMCDKVE
ncbi:MAG: hypothetical protein IJJ74_10920 [Eubacterium sp.]|nr:hypothetical protein [Eubacterium sp.]